MKTSVRDRKLQRQARSALLGKYERLKNWRSVECETGIKFGTANAIARGKRPASKKDIEKLFPKKKRYYINYRKREHYLRMWIRRKLGE